MTVGVPSILRPIPLFAKFIPHQTYDDLLDRTPFMFIPLDPDHIREFSRDVAVPEMHDRIIAGVARRLNIPLITADPLIAAANVVRIVW